MLRQIKSENNKHTLSKGGKKKTHTHTYMMANSHGSEKCMAPQMSCDRKNNIKNELSIKILVKGG